MNNKHDEKRDPNVDGDKFSRVPLGREESLKSIEKADDGKEDHTEPSNRFTLSCTVGQPCSVDALDL
jgi:hypothetical protein